MTSLRGDFAKDVYAKLDIPFNRVNRIIGIAWAAIEGSDARFNPWDTTEPWAGATDFNSVGVKDYLTWEDGVDATVATLKNSLYDHIIATLKNPNATVIEKLNAINSSPWGSHISEQLYSDVARELPKYDKIVSGANPTPPKPKEDEPANKEEPPVATQLPAEPVDPQPVAPDKPPAVEEPPKPATPTASDNVDTSTDPPTPFVTVELPIFKSGDKNRGVFIATTLLKQWGYYPEALAPTSEFNEDVVAAVKKFQEFFRITANSEMDSEFWNAFFTQ